MVATPRGRVGPTCVKELMWKAASVSLRALSASAASDRGAGQEGI